MNIYGIISWSRCCVVVVVVVDVVKSLMLYVVVELVVESMHTHIKLGAHALLNV